jgi:hypothetical protein
MTPIRLASILATRALFDAALLSSLPAFAAVDPSRSLDKFNATFGTFEDFRGSVAKGMCG